MSADVATRETRSRLRRLGLGFAHPGSLRAVLLVALGLLLETLAQPPGPLPALVFVQDVPFLLLLFRGESARRWKRWAALYAFLHFALALHWLSEIHPVQALAAPLVLVPTWLLAAWAIRLLAGRRVPFVLVVPVVFVLEELLRTVWLGGMPWPARSLAFAGWPAFAPASAFFGAYALSFVAAMTSAALVGPPRSRAGPFRWCGPLFRLTAPLAALLVIALLAWSRIGRVASPGASPGVLVAVQGNIPQNLKHSPDPDDANRMFRAHVALSRDGLEDVRARHETPLGVLWPETMVPWPFLDADLARRFPEAWENEVRVSQNVRAVASEDPSDPPFLLGVLDLFRRDEERHLDLYAYGTHDSLVLVDPARVPPPDLPMPEPPPLGGRPAWILGRHDKHVLVPGGEYTPLGDLLPPLRWFRSLVSEIPELDPGAAAQTPFRLPLAGAPKEQVRLDTVICFELLFPARCRALRADGADVLLNPANYGWFGETSFRAQIRAAAALRAAETGARVVLAGNTGPTLGIDPAGRPIGRFVAAEGRADPSLLSDRNTFREGFAVVPLARAGEPTPYLGWGDLPWFVLGGILLVWGLLGKPRPDDGSVTSGAYSIPRAIREGENL